MQLSTPLTEDAKASVKEKTGVLAHQAKLRAELAIALANNETEYNRLIDINKDI